MEGRRGAAWPGGREHAPSRSGRGGCGLLCARRAPWRSGGTRGRAWPRRQPRGGRQTAREVGVSGVRISGLRPWDRGEAGATTGAGGGAGAHRTTHQRADRLEHGALLLQQGLVPGRRKCQTGDAAEAPRDGAGAGRLTAHFAICACLAAAPECRTSGEEIGDASERIYLKPVSIGACGG